MSWTQWDEQIFEMLSRLRRAEGSRAAAVGKQCQMIVSDNPDRNKSRCASVTGINKVKEIHDFINRGY